MDRVKNISKSMIAYIKRTREHKEFLLRETKEFERGKRHLANMMGLESQEMTQTDIDDAIKYLFPSGLFDKRARPTMKHPDLIFKAQKDAQFDEEGRPYHHLFYTTKPNYFEGLADLGEKLRELNKFEDEKLAEGIIDAPSDAKYNLTGRTFLSYQQLSDKFLEKIHPPDYDYFIRSLKHLMAHPYSSRIKTTFEDYSVPLTSHSAKLVLPEIKRDEETGQIYTEMVEFRREHQVGVKVVLNGSGRIDIEGRDILFFEHPYMRTALLYPLTVAGMTDKVDIFAKIIKQPETYGPSAVAGAIRLAISHSLAAYVDKETRERLRVGGLLERDTRTRERKKYGQEGARRKFTWKKR